MNIYIKTIGNVFATILILTLFLTFFHYFNIINEKILEILKIITITASIFIGGYKIGKQSFKKGWLEGIKFALIMIVIFLILSWIFRLGIELKTIVYYFIILVSSMLGGMIGINKRKTDENE
jgi:putative membrane protein (TIGR04086 family)